MSLFSKLLETIRMNRALGGRIQGLKRDQAQLLAELKKQDIARLEQRIDSLQQILADRDERHETMLALLQEMKAVGLASRLDDIAQQQSRRFDELGNGKYARLESRLTQLANQQQRVLAELRGLTSGALGVRLDEIKIEQGRILSEMRRGSESNRLQDYEFRVFSQWGEDGILQHLARRLEIPNTTFIEFGVQDFSESNCRFLMMKDHWSGYVLDGSVENIKRLKSAYYYWRYGLTGLDAFITRSNINDLLAKSGFDSDLGILSIDLDGVDYWILEAIEGFRPRILVLEYNAVFGSERAISVPYDEKFVRTERHHSNLYFGASLPALAHLARRRGYGLVGTNTAGVNAFFVRDDVINDHVPAVSVEEAFTPSTHRESRNADGRLTFLSGEDRIEEVRGMPVVNVVTGQEERL